MPGHLIITRGLPGSGKSTTARRWVEEDSLRRCRLNRDDFRAMMFGGYTGQSAHEHAVTVAQHAAIRRLLVAGWHVVADDTNILDHHVETLRLLAASSAVQFEVWDLRDVPLETCIARDAQRAVPVGEQTIRRMHTKMVAVKLVAAQQ
jgi:predicted kinase